MKKFFTCFAVLTAMVSMISCGGDNKSKNATGTLGGECYGNKSCNDGLICDEENNTCVERLTIQIHRLNRQIMIQTQRQTMTTIQRILLIQTTLRIPTQQVTILQNVSQIHAKKCKILQETAQQTFTLQSLQIFTTNMSVNVKRDMFLTELPA